MKIIDLNYASAKKQIIDELGLFIDENSPNAVAVDENEEDLMKEALLSETEKFSFAMEDNNQILGKIYGEIDMMNHEIRIDGLIVSQKARGTGVGSILMNRAEELGRKKGCFMAFVNTTASSAPRFYEKLGYHLLATFKDYPSVGDEYYFYAKNFINN